LYLRIMEHNFATYDIEIKNHKYIADDGRKFPKTAIITFRNKDGVICGTELFGNMDTTDIYKLINEGSELNLDNCYIKDFDINTYRQNYGLDSKAVVKFKCFSASTAFFESHPVTDFSYCDFGDGDTSFESTWFGNGRVSFHNSVFGNGNVIFSGVFIKEGNLDFAGTVVGDGDFVFKNAAIGEGVKDFQDMRFGRGGVNSLLRFQECFQGRLIFIMLHLAPEMWFLRGLNLVIAGLISGLLILGREGLISTDRYLDQEISTLREQASQVIASSLNGFL